MPRPKDLYQDIVDITADYLGPAAERFVVRQIQNHVGKTPQAIAASDIETLITWSKPAMALLTSDESIVDEFIERLSALTGTPA
ncbi:MAG TPA: hypothetical protein VLE74_04065 [Candidatus Saccharimonadales bacterium]|nr:hypothetical protein [Candidatus Saccharimonadales bacterium]